MKNKNNESKILFLLIINMLELILSICVYVFEIFGIEGYIVTSIFVISVNVATLYTIKLSKEK